jgi:hypothetical protein
MSRAILFFLTLLLMQQRAAASEKNLRDQWMTFDGNNYQLLDSAAHPALTTVYVRLNASLYPASRLSISSGEDFFLFINGKLVREHRGTLKLNVDSLVNVYYSPTLLLAIHQKKINERELKIYLDSSTSKPAQVISMDRPYTWFRDFVVAAGLIIIVLFLIISRLNPKLASDYFSVIKVFSMREADDIQSTARLTSSTNVQFYICCSLLLGYYLLILFHHLPSDYSLPIQFQAHSFGSVFWQWIKLSSIVLGFLIAKITVIFALTRLFSMRGMARLHFFNWVRLMLLVFGFCSIIVFLYFINRGQQTTFFVVFLSLVSATLIGWVLLAFLKLNGKSEHSLFHLFSYICATEIIPLLITVKVLYQ